MTQQEQAERWQTNLLVLGRIIREEYTLDDVEWLAAELGMLPVFKQLMGDDE
jgi:hypothetical protein